jgi:hypothetical protein
MMQSTDVKLSDIQPGPIPQAELPPELTERIKAFKAILGDVDPSSLEQAFPRIRVTTPWRGILARPCRVALTKTCPVDSDFALEE